MSRKLLSVIMGVAFLGGVFGAIISAESVGANVFDDIYDFLKRNFTSISTPQGDIPADAKIEVIEQKEEKQIPLYKPVIDYEEAVVGAVEKASPSVVSIVISKDLPVIEQCPYNPFGDLPPEFRDFFGGGFEFSQPCQKGTKRQEVGGGSGFIVSSDGLIVTNKHVVLDTKADYTVLTNDGKKYDAKVLARDPAKDLAVIKINASGLVPAKLGDSDSVKLGQTAIAIGNALGEFRNTVSVGVISGLSRNITAGGGGFTERIEGVLQTDSAINQGNSGGPLLNLKGEVIGINVAVASGAQNIGFAIPINQAKRAIDSVKKTGSIKSPYVGVRYLMINEEIAKKQKLLVEYGALVRGTEDGLGVIPDSPAAKAGILAEDIILEINGVKLSDGKTIGSEIQKYDIGDSIALKIQRQDKIINLNVTLGERPEL